MSGASLSSVFFFKRFCVKLASAHTMTSGAFELKTLRHQKCTTNSDLDILLVVAHEQFSKADGAAMTEIR